MKTWRSAVLSFLLVLTSVSTECWGQAPTLVRPASNCICDVNKSDEFENPVKFNFGNFAGQCIDSCRFRKSAFLTDERKKIVVLSNFMHDGNFWRARVPLDGVDHAEVGFEEFLPGIYHVFLVFHFEATAPISLTPQEGKPAAAKKIYSLVISPEGIPPKEGQYRLIDAYQERYLIGIRLLSRKQVVDWSATKLKHKITLYPIDMQKSQVRELLQIGLAVGERNSFQVKYGLFSNNCATSTLDLIDKIIKPEVARYPLYYKFLYGLERSLPVAGPIGTLNILLSRNIITNQPISIEPGP